MLAVTQTAVDVIKHIAPGDTGLRLFVSGGAPGIQALQVEIAEAPRADDRVVEAEGATVFLEGGRPTRSKTWCSTRRRKPTASASPSRTSTRRGPRPGEAGDSSAG